MFLSYIPIQHIYSVFVYQAEALFEILIIEVRIPDILRRSKNLIQNIKTSALWIFFQK